MKLLTYIVALFVLGGCKKEISYRDELKSSFDTMEVVLLIQKPITTRQDTFDLVNSCQAKYSAYDSVLVYKKTSIIRGNTYSVTDESISAMILKYFGKTRYKYIGHPVVIVNMN